MDVDARDSFGGIALHAAMFQDDIKIVQAVIDYGFDVNAQKIANGFTPLHDAVGADNLSAAKLLIENRPDPSIPNKDGQPRQSVSAAASATPRRALAAYISAVTK